MSCAEPQKPDAVEVAERDRILRPDPFGPASPHGTCSINPATYPCCRGLVLQSNPAARIPAGDMSASFHGEGCGQAYNDTVADAARSGLHGGREPDAIKSARRQLASFSPCPGPATPLHASIATTVPAGCWPSHAAKASRLNACRRSTCPAAFT